MLCYGHKKERQQTPDVAATPQRPNSTRGTNNAASMGPKEPPSMVIQGDFRKVSGISNEIFRQIETIENDYDASTAAALEAVERRGEMIVRILDPKHLGKAAAEAAKKFFCLQDSKHTVLLVEIIKRPGQTLGLYIREGNGLERGDGVFISRIALESAVYDSRCIQVGDEILAVNLVDVTRMGIDDVVIIMSIPRRLVLVTRHFKGYPSSNVINSGHYGTLSHGRPPEPKPPPVVVLKKDFSKEEEFDDDDDDRHWDSAHYRNGTMSYAHEKSSSQFALDSNGDLGADLYYNSRPESRRHHQTSTLDRRISGWTYTPQSQILERHLKQVGSYHTPFDRNQPKTLESLAEKVHSFSPSGSATLGRRTSDTTLSMRQTVNQRMIRSGSDQHLPRVEYEDYSRTLPTRQSHYLRQGPCSGAAMFNYNQQCNTGNSLSTSNSSIVKRHSVDYASDTEASYPSTPKSSSHYYYRLPNSPAISGISSQTLSRLAKSNSFSKSSLCSNSLPRDCRSVRNQLSSLTLSQNSNIKMKHGTHTNSANNSLEEDYGRFLGAQELSLYDKIRRDILPPRATNFASNEYRSWLSRTPSTSAIYDQLKCNRVDSLLRQKSRFTFSAENLPEQTRQAELWYGSKYRMNPVTPIEPINVIPLPSAAVTTLDRHTRMSSLRRMKYLQQLEAKHLGNGSGLPNVQIDRSKVLEINTSEFNKYKMEKTPFNDEYPLVSGLLWIHLLAGRGLRSITTNTPLAGGNTTTTDLYCVLECDRIHKARTVMRSGDLVFDWDETFELDLFNNRELDFLVYSWDPQYRHKLCYKGSIHLASLLNKSPIHQLALKLEPRGTLYIRIRHTSPFHTYSRKPSRPLLPSRNLLNMSNLFGADLESVLSKDCDSVSSSIQSLSRESLATSVPVIIRRCVEEVERRGLEIVGIYRLCGSATKKRILREALERNSRMTDLSPNNVPDINVITGVFKDYLRELPEPLFTKHLYQMIVDALSVCMSDDPQGNAELIFSLLDCLSKGNKATLIFVMDHLSLIVSQSAINKMSSQNLSIIFAPLLMIKSESEGKEIDFNQPINILRYLLDVWPSKSGITFFQIVREMATGAGKTSTVLMDHPPPLPKKPSAVSAQGGDPLPIPLKRMQKPPPAIPTRFTQAAIASQTTESNGSMISTSSSEGSKFLEPGINKSASNGESIQGTPRLWSKQGNGRWTLNQDGVQQDPVEGRGQPETYSNVCSNVMVSRSNTTGTSSSSSKVIPYEMRNGYREGAENHVGKLSDACTLKTVGYENGNGVPSRLASGNAKMSSNSTTVIPKHFGHVDGDKCTLTQRAIKMDSTLWDDFVRSRIKENEDDSSNSSDSLVDESFRQSQNPFLGDLNNTETTGSRKSTFSNGFGFCADSPSKSNS